MIHDLIRSFLLLTTLFTSLFTTVLAQEQDSEIQLNFDFCHCYFNTDDLSFIGLVVTPSQQIYRTSLLSTKIPDEVITLPIPNEKGVYTIIFYIKELSADFEMGEFGRVCITNNSNDEMAYFSAEATCISWKGQQISFQYVLAP